MTHLHQKHISMKQLYTILMASAALLSAAQTSGSHKTYSGSFGDGTATYTYLTAPDGQRIFDGSFKKTSETEQSGQTIFSGKFQNNCQTGQWTLTETIGHGHPHAKVKTVTTITFDENGVLDGPITKTDYYRNGKSVLRLKATMKKGVPHGSFYRTFDYKNDTVRGQYTNGIRTGLWHIPYKAPVVDYGTDGTPTASIVDPETGDITKLSTEYINREIDAYYGPHNTDYMTWLEPIITELTLRDSRMAYCRPQQPESSFNGQSYLISFNGIYISGMPSCHTSTNIPAGKFTWPQNKPRPESPVKIDFTILIEMDGSCKVIDIAGLESYQEITAQFASMLNSMKFGTGQIELRMVGNATIIIDPKAIEFPDIPEPEPVAVQNAEPETIYTSADERPVFPGGDAAMFKHIANKLRYPVSAAESGVQGRVILKCVILSDGSIGDIEVSRSRHPALDKEAIRVVKSLPKFTPGKINGMPVNLWFTIPITFKLQ